MEKINAILGNAHGDFDRQLKNLLNEMSDVIEKISINQLSSKDSEDSEDSDNYSLLCNICLKQADFVTTNLKDKSNKAYCNNCLSNP